MCNDLVLLLFCGIDESGAVLITDESGAVLITKNGKKEKRKKEKNEEKERKKCILALP